VNEPACLPARLAVLGPESCGKSTLVDALLQRCLEHGIAAAAVPEFARDYYRTRPYRPTRDDIVAIARGQLAAERACGADVALLLCDTTVTTCKIWFEVAFGGCDAELLALHHPDRYGLTLLTRPDIPWQFDPLRSHPHERESLWQRYRSELAAAGIAAVDIAGSHAQRVETAWRALRQRWPDLPII
jgi:nicotinamide riboside kinase